MDGYIKSFRLGIGVLFILLAVGLSAGCKTANGSGSVTELAVESERSIARIEYINQELGRIGERERRAIASLYDGSRSLEDILNEVFSISYRLLDEIDRLRAETGAIRKALLMGDLFTAGDITKIGNLPKQKEKKYKLVVKRRRLV